MIERKETTNWETASDCETINDSCDQSSTKSFNTREPKLRFIGPRNFERGVITRPDSLDESDEWVLEASDSSADEAPESHEDDISIDEHSSPSFSGNDDAEGENSHSDSTESEDSGAGDDNEDVEEENDPVDPNDHDISEQIAEH